MPPRNAARRRALRALVHGAALAGAAALGACALPDQRTFGTAAYRPPVPPPAPAKPPPPPWPGPSPLVVIRFANLSADYAGPLGDAVRAAEERKPDVAFLVVGVAPAAGSPAAQMTAAADAAKAAVTVTQAIARMGVPTERLLLGARTDPTVQAEQVEIYVR
ncbi:MAG: hypothetical protein ACREFS_11465 [Acetobacteraceae bacterium]